MSPQDYIHEVMSELGAAIDAQQVTAGPAPGFWQVAIDEHTVFDVEYDALFERVVLSSRIASLREEGRLALCVLLLNFNMAWRETGGVRMALDPGTEDVVMMFEMPVAAFRLSQLCTVLGNIATAHRTWRQALLTA